MLEIFLIIFILIILFVIFAVTFKNGVGKVIPGAGSSFSKGDSPDIVMNKAHNLYEMGQLSKAIKLLEEYHRVNPDEISVRLLLGEYLLKKNYPSKAQKHFSHILKLDPSHFKALENFSDCCGLLGKYEKALGGYYTILRESPDDLEVRAKVAEIYVKQDNIDQAIKEYRAILAKDHFNTPVKQNLADLFFQKGDYKRAVVEYEEIIKVDGIDVNILKRIAKAHYASENYADAALAYKKIIDHNDSAIFAYKELAEVYIKINKFDKAAKIYSQMIDKGVDVQPKFLKRLADIYVMSDEYDKAIDLANKILAENPDFLPAREALGNAYRKKGKFKDAFSNFKILISENINPKKINDYKRTVSSLLCDWGNEHFMQKEYQDAMDKYVEAIQYDSTNPEIYLNLGKTNQAVKNYDAAFSHFNKALELSTSDISILLNIGQAYKQVDQINAAIDLYYDAVKKHPNNFEIRLALGVTLGSAGFYSQAETELNMATTISPDNPLGFYNLGLIYERQNNFKEAKSQYKKALDIDPNYHEARNHLNFLMEEAVSERESKE